MKKTLAFLQQFRVLLFAAAETGFAMVAIIVVVYLLLGADSGGFVLSVMANISLFVDAVTPQAFIGAALVLGFITVLRSR
jgi:hypothetical protein